MRGQQLFSATFASQPVKQANRHTRGRSKEYDIKRNEHLVYRYVYYGLYTNKRYESIIQLLVSEFYLASATINNIISDQVATIAALKKAPPEKSFLKQKYPHWRWD